MLKYNNDNILIEAGINKEHVFFYQLWKELTHNKTLDSYQFRIKNTLNSIEELVMLIQAAVNNTYKTNYAIRSCIDETREIIKNDEVLKRFYPVIRGGLISKLSCNIDSIYSKRMLIDTLEYSQHAINDKYVDNLFLLVEEAIENDDRDSLITLTNQLVSVSAFRGWSERALHKKIDILKNYEEEKSSWNQFKTNISNMIPDYYDVLFPVKQGLLDRISKVDCAVFGASLKGYEEVCQDYNVGDILAKRTHLIIRVNAFDYYSASEKAISKYENIVNMIDFYGDVSTSTSNDLSWIVFNSRNRTYQKVTLSEIHGTYSYIEGSEAAYNNAKEIMMRIPESETAITNKLVAAYNYARIARRSYSMEQKLFNNWIALESLCRTGAYDTVIENVIKIVPATLCIRYLYKLMRNYIEDCNRCEIDLCNLIDYKECLTKEKQVKRMIEIMNDTEEYNLLYKMCGVNSLLLKRTEIIHCLFSDKEKMVKKVDAHYKNISMQLNRIYRIRNQITHLAYRTETSLLKYCEHLEDYLISFVNEVTRISIDLSMYNSSLLFEYLRDNYEAFSEATSPKKNKIIGHTIENRMNQFYKTGMMQLFKEVDNDGSNI